MRAFYDANPPNFKLKKEHDMTIQSSYTYCDSKPMRKFMKCALITEP